MGDASKAYMHFLKRGILARDLEFLQLLANVNDIDTKKRFLHAIPWSKGVETKRMTFHHSTMKANFIELTHIRLLRT